MWCIKSQVLWLVQHAKRAEGQMFCVCKDTGAPILGTLIGRLVRVMSGSGTDEIRDVMHWSCPSHDDAVQVRHGTPINENELVYFNLPLIHGNA